MRSSSPLLDVAAWPGARRTHFVRCCRGKAPSASFPPTYEFPAAHSRIIAIVRIVRISSVTFTHDHGAVPVHLPVTPLTRKRYGFWWYSYADTQIGSSAFL